jgi:hypothetical protein
MRRDAAVIGRRRRGSGNVVLICFSFGDGLECVGEIGKGGGLSCSILKLWGSWPEGGGGSAPFEAARETDVGRIVMIWGR